jgi:uncharacterized membrane protein
MLSRAQTFAVIGAIIGVLLVTIGFYKLIVVIVITIIAYFLSYINWEEVYKRLYELIQRSE